MLVMLIIAMFIILLGFMSFSGQQADLPLTNTQNNNQPGAQTEVASESLAIPDEQAMQLHYLQEQLTNERNETSLDYQKQIEVQRLEYANLTEQQRMLHEKSLQESSQKNAIHLKQQELQKDYLQGQKELSQLNTKKQHEANTTNALLTFEKEKQQMTQAHEAALAIQKSEAEQRSMLNIALVFATFIVSTSLAYFLVSSLKIRREKELAQIEYDKLFALKQQESMQATRIKVLDSIADLPGPDKKEIIEGLVGLNRSYDVLESKSQDNPPIEIELTELTPPQMQPVNNT